MEMSFISREMSCPHGQLPGSLELAYLGDAIFELYVRARLVASGGRMKDLHRRAIATVCAHAQAASLTRIEGLLTPDEADVVRRARNTRQTPTKNADAREYRRATGFEALLGYLALMGRQERLEELLAVVLEKEGEEKHGV